MKKWYHFWKSRTTFQKTLRLFRIYSCLAAGYSYLMFGNSCLMNENSCYSIDGINRKPRYTRAMYLSLIQKRK